MRDPRRLPPHACARRIPPEAGRRDRRTARARLERRRLVDGLAAVLLLGLAPAMAACGGSGASGAPVDTTLVATLGDSITAGSPGYDPDPRMRDALGFG